MQPTGYVAFVITYDGRRLYCANAAKDYWTGKFSAAVRFREAYTASSVAARYDGQVMSWSDAWMLDAPEKAPALRWQDAQAAATWPAVSS